MKPKLIRFFIYITILLYSGLMAAAITEELPLFTAWVITSITLVLGCFLPGLMEWLRDWERDQ